MNKVREILIDRMIQLYGHEDKAVIQFVEVCERKPYDSFWTNVLTDIVECHETLYRINNSV